MLKTLVTAAGAALLSASFGTFSGDATAQAGWSTPYYYIAYFSEPSQTNQIGYNVQQCLPTGQIVNNFHGSQSQYERRDLIGYCGSGGDEPF